MTFDNQVKYLYQKDPTLNIKKKKTLKSHTKKKFSIPSLLMFLQNKSEHFFTNLFTSFLPKSL